MPGRSHRDNPAPETAARIRGTLEHRLEPVFPQPGGRPPPAIPDYRLVQRIGAGAYGEVFAARNALGTLRAVKVVYRDRFEEERPYQRELNGILRYEPISRSHEGLVAVLHVGCNEAQGYFYYLMELADDAGLDGGPDAKPKPYVPRTLKEELRCRGRLSTVEAAQVALAVGGALAHLHRQGLVHRDVKPSNVIFIGGKPKLADIGLVTGAGDSRSFVGTEGFIPPEGPGTAGADLYSLGKLLYELATGRDRLEFPRLPADLPEPGEAESLLDLNEIITRACAPRPQERYATTIEIIADLNLFLSGRSLRGARKLQQHLTWLKRFLAAACLVLALAGGAVWLARQAALRAHEREEQSRETAVVEAALRRRAEAAERDSRRQLHAALLEEAYGLVRSRELGQRVRALAAIRQAADSSNMPTLRSLALSALALPDLRFERELSVGPGAKAWSFDPGFERLAICQSNGLVEIDSVTAPGPPLVLPRSADFRASSVRWSADGRYLAVRRDATIDGRDTQVEVWDTGASRQVLLLTNVSWGAAAFHPRLPRFFAASLQGRLGCWDLQTGREIGGFELPGEPGFLAVAPEGQRLAVACKTPNGWRLSIHRLVDGTRLAGLVLNDAISSMDWHPRGRWIGAVDYGGSVYLIDPLKAQAHFLGRHKAQAVFAAFSPDGNYLLTGGWERELTCWDVRTRERALQISLGSFFAQFSPEGPKCAIATGPTVRIYDFALPECRDFEEDLGGRVRRAVFSPDGRWLAATGKDRLGVWDLAAGAADGWVTHLAGATAICFSPDSSQIYASCQDNCFRWRLRGATAGGRPVLQPLALPQPQGFCSVCLSTNALCFTDSRGTKISPPTDPTGAAGTWHDTISGLNGVSPDGQWLAIFQSFSPLVNVYHLPECKPVTTLTNRDNICGFEFSAAGDQLVVCSSHRVELWSTRTWRRVRDFTNAMGFMFSGDVNLAWLIRDYQHAGLEDLRALTPVLPLPDGTLPLALSPDGRYLAVSVDARLVRLWDLKRVHAAFQQIGINRSPADEGAARAPGVR